MNDSNATIASGATTSAPSLMADHDDQPRRTADATAARLGCCGGDCTHAESDAARMSKPCRFCGKPAGLGALLKYDGKTRIPSMCQPCKDKADEEAERRALGAFVAITKPTYTPAKRPLDAAKPTLLKKALLVRQLGAKAAQHIDTALEAFEGGWTPANSRIASNALYAAQACLIAAEKADDFYGWVLADSGEEAMDNADALLNSAFEWAKLDFPIVKLCPKCKSNVSRDDHGAEPDVGVAAFHGLACDSCDWTLSDDESDDARIGKAHQPLHFLHTEDGVRAALGM